MIEAKYLQKTKNQEKRLGFIKLILLISVLIELVERSEHSKRSTYVFTLMVYL